MKLTGMRRFAVIAAISVSCSTPHAPAPLPPGCFAFGVFGDGPYHGWEEGRFHRLIGDVNRADISWLIHVGDIFWCPCSDAHYDEMRATFDAIQHPVVYTPGDNEWADCHKKLSGGYQPLERLARLRRTFFADPSRTLGAKPMRVVSQSEMPGYTEFVENVRWVTGGFVFATVDVVGSDDAGAMFPGRTVADDSAMTRRVAAAEAWLDEAFDIARHDSLHGVIVAMHAYPSFAEPEYGDILRRLKDFALSFDGDVVLVHGDMHKFGVDHPVWNPPQPKPIQNLTRIGTFGSPDIGWVRVVVDSVAGRIVDVQPRKIGRWWWPW